MDREVYKALWESRSKAKALGYDWDVRDAVEALDEAGFIVVKLPDNVNG